MKFVPTILLAGLVVAVPVAAQQAAPKADDHAAHHGGASQQGELVDAEVRRVDPAAAKITLRHEPIKSLDMPRMTMVFEVRDRSLLDKVKVGDKVKFRAVAEGGKVLVTELQLAP